MEGIIILILYIIKRSRIVYFILPVDDTEPCDVAYSAV